MPVERGRRLGRRRWRPSASVAAPSGDAGSVALLALLGGGLALLVALVPVVVVADLMVTRGRAQLAADAAALAAMRAGGGGLPQAAGVVGGGRSYAAGVAGGGRGVAARVAGDGRSDAARVAAANGGRLRSCCGDDPWRREVTVDVAPASVLLSVVVPTVRASAAAALVAATPPMAGGGLGVVGAAGPRAWPLRAPVTSRFGVRTHPLSGASRLHAGIDLGAASGTPIGAAAAGTVVAAGAMGGYGNTVDVRHGDGVTTRYAHQSQVFVRAGQQVVAGQAIGLVGSTGASTGPHLHFEVRTPAGPIDPLTWLP